MSKEIKKEAELSVIEVLKRIKEGGLDPALLSKESRQECVGALVVEGYSSGQVASLLKKSDRTIRRDLEEVRTNNSIFASPEFTAMIGGELLSMARNQYARLKQLARSNEVPGEEKARVEYMSWLIFKELTDKLHKVGFLPTAKKPTVEKQSLPKNLEKKKDQDEYTIDPAMLKIYEVMSPMDRERLIEKLHRDIVGFKEEEEKEESSKPSD
jgi:transposase